MANPATQHAKLSFSARARWSQCPLSIVLAESLPADAEDRSSPAAAEGTAAHTAAEWYLKRDCKLGDGANWSLCPEPDVPEGLDLKGDTVTQWRAKLRLHGNQYSMYVQDLIKHYNAGTLEGAFIVVEHKVAAKALHPDLFGTADCLVWLSGPRILLVIDYKYGFADVFVGTPDAPNKQAEAYALAAIETTGVEPLGVVLAIYQPRRAIGMPGQTLELNAADWLATARERMRQEALAVDAARAAAARGEAITPVPGDHCRYCRGTPKCPVVTHAGKAALAAYANTQTLLDLAEAEVIALWSARTAFKNFWESIDERIKIMAKSGHAGLKVKQSNGRKMWADPKAAALTLLAMGRADLVQAVALSEAIHVIPKEYHEGLIKTSAPATTIEAVTKVSPNEVAQLFAKYGKD